MTPPQPKPCAGCGAPNPCFGIGPPLLAVLKWFCGICNQFQPATQEALARVAREAIDDEAHLTHGETM